jgi:hypothetical protein
MPPTDSENAAGVVPEPMEEFAAESWLGLETDPRAIASGTVANPCNPAAPEVPLWQPCRLVVRRKPAGRQMLLDNSVAAARMPSGSHWKTTTKQSSWQAPELWRSQPKLAVPVRFDRPQIDRIRSPLTTMPASPYDRTIAVLVDLKASHQKTKAPAREGPGLSHVVCVVQMVRLFRLIRWDGVNQKGGPEKFVCRLAAPKITSRPRTPSMAARLGVAFHGCVARSVQGQGASEPLYLGSVSSITEAARSQARAISSRVPRSRPSRQPIEKLDVAPAMGEPSC